MNDQKTSEIDRVPKNKPMHSSFLRLCGLWPPNKNNPDLNPVDYKIWSLVQERVYRQPISNIDELRERIVAVWEAVDH